MLPLSTAMRTSGAADLIAARLVDVVGDAGPGPLLFALFVVTALLGQVMSNTATTLILIPIGLAAAGQLDVAIEPVLMCIGVGSAAALLTPVATPSNMMVMDPGGYRFGDYWKLGSVVLVWYALVAVVFVPFVLGT
jgi:di/tricarboxylate transporter